MLLAHVGLGAGCTATTVHLALEVPGTKCSALMRTVNIAARLPTYRARCIDSEQEIAKAKSHRMMTNDNNSSSSSRSTNHAAAGTCLRAPMSLRQELYPGSRICEAALCFIQYGVRVMSMLAATLGAVEATAINGNTAFRGPIHIAARRAHRIPSPGLLPRTYW